MDVDSQLELIVYSQTPHLQKEDPKFELTTEYLIIPTQGPNAQRSKGKGEKLVTSQNQCSLDEYFNFLSQDEIEEGYLYERIFFYSRYESCKASYLRFY